MLRGVLDSILPLLAGGTMLILACCLAATGVRRFYGQDMSWRLTAAVTGLSFAGLAVLHRRGRLHADADLHLFAGDVDPDGDDLEVAAVAAATAASIPAPGLPASSRS